MTVRIFLMLSLFCLPGVAQEQPSATTDLASPAVIATAASPDNVELQAIRKSSEDFVKAFNSGDAKAVAQLWTEDGDYIDETGQAYAGREAIEQAYASFFASHQGVQMRVIIDSLRLLSSNAAIEDGRAFLQPAPAGAPAIGKYTVVHVKVDGKWLMSTVRDVAVPTASSFGNLADLEWLIGSWVAEEHGAKMETDCRWVANKSFVQRSYTVTLPDQTTTSGVQLIGFNPLEGHIQSWEFSPDGGHAVGVWTTHEGGWTAEMRGVSGDGSPTASVNTITMLDDNAYAWQSFQRRIGDVALPDTDEVVIKRNSKE
jgi:uncharacterized protein (TIGR02246 family)